MRMKYLEFRNRRNPARSIPGVSWPLIPIFNHRAARGFNTASSFLVGSMLYSFDQSSYTSNGVNGKFSADSTKKSEPAEKGQMTLFVRVDLDDDDFEGTAAAPFWCPLEDVTTTTYFIRKDIARTSTIAAALKW